jgi:hypothetical protein
MLSSGLFTSICSLNANVLEQTLCSKMLEFKLQTLVNHPEESIQHSELGESLKLWKYLSYIEKTVKLLM